ncbi:GNAT family N-acetyltransferase [Panacibacter sp. DH6]|uniref:GNAT family N-acetyltransferase n=1 Tax=Panacibacter microcysteis TaxID=2793269 RepID=A0A931GYQ0_9BACT|nr:GNAT family N-acetyltransferase [Panacibacter microcysteis]MBG9377157.1 GNAT family N-acetyltransferase [Panacibacter microcysteis]
MPLSQYATHSLLPDIARCHMASFPASFSTRLGLAYNIKSLEWFLAGDNRFLFCIQEDGKVMAYCGGYQSRGTGDGSTSGMMQHAMKEAAIGMLKKPWLFFHKDVIKFYPLIFKNIARKLSPRKKNAAVIKPVNTRPAATGLVVIGVHPAYRGKGYFELLMQSFECESSKRGVSQMILSVRADNARAIAAYKKMGWLTSLQTEKVLEMCKTLQDA